MKPIPIAVPVFCLIPLLLMDGEADRSNTQNENAFLELLHRTVEGTEYAAGYSEQAFQKIKIGDSIQSVEAKIGKPLGTRPDKPYTAWLYAPDQNPNFAATGEYPPIHQACNVITFDEEGRFIDSYGQSAGTEKQVGDGTLGLTGKISFQGRISGPLGLSDEKIAELKQKGTTQDVFRKRALLCCIERRQIGRFEHRNGPQGIYRPFPPWRRGRWHRIVAAPVRRPPCVPRACS